jgi:hypothetical protein
MINSSLISATVSKSKSATRGSRAVAGVRRTLARLCLALATLVAAAPAKAAADPTLAELLDHVGRQVEHFWSYFPSVTCTETVTQSKLGDKGKVLFVQHQAFDYLIALQSSGQDISVDESRLQKIHKGSKAKVSLLETNGFAIFSLLFHPLYQSRYEFRQVPDESSPDHRLLCITFQQVSREHPLSVLKIRDLVYPLEWRGKAWIDAASWAVVRIQAGLGDSMADSGLLQLNADVAYSAVHFSDSTEDWLPARADIDAETKRQHWHNSHVFTSYKRFEVDTDVKISNPQ